MPIIDLCGDFLRKAVSVVHKNSTKKTDEYKLIFYRKQGNRSIIDTFDVVNIF